MIGVMSHRRGGMLFRWTFPLGFARSRALLADAMHSLAKLPFAQVQHPALLVSWRRASGISCGSDSTFLVGREQLVI
jgi:hypothetical protein